MKTFACTSFDNGAHEFLTAELTLPCDASNTRQFWTGYATLFVLVYPVGVPALMFSVLYCNRDEIRRVMREAQLATIALDESAELRIKDIIGSENLVLRSITQLFENFVRSRLAASRAVLSLAHTVFCKPTQALSLCVL